MLGIIGMVVTLALVFGGFLASGGKIGVILSALPFELVMIGGASFGAFLLGNSGAVAKAAAKDIGVCFKGPKWDKQDYIDLLVLLFTLTKTMKSKGLLAIEEHVEDPSNSDIFSKYPKIEADHLAIDLICDVLRMVTMNLEDPYQVEDIILAQLDKHHHETLEPSGALQSVADGLPAIGIVAAVLGVIKTMSSVDKPPPILGKMIGGALVGTFLGVFLSYCFMGPIASKAKAIHEQDAQFYIIIKNVIIAHLKGCAPQVSVEIGRGCVPSQCQPSFTELEEALSSE